MKHLFEVGVLTRHAATVWVGQVAIMGFGLADTLIAGRHSDAALAALSVGSAVYISVYVALLGLLQAQLPIWAEMRGAGHHAELGVSVRQGVYLMLFATVLGWCGLLTAPALLAWTDVPEAMRPMVGDYLDVVAVGLLPTLAFRLFSTLNQALGKPKLVTWVQAGALCLKVPLSWWFAFGGLGLPAGGAADEVIKHAGLPIVGVVLERVQNGQHTLASLVLGDPPALHADADRGELETHARNRDHRRACAVGDHERRRDARIPEVVEAGPLDLIEELLRVDHRAVPDHVHLLGIEDPGGNQVEGVLLVAHHDGVSRVGAAVVADDGVVLRGQEVDDLAFALIPPLKADDGGVAHMRWQRTFTAQPALSAGPWLGSGVCSWLVY